MGPIAGPAVPRTEHAPARLEQQPDQPHLAVCPSLYLADYRPLGGMLGDLPAPEAMMVRLPKAWVCHSQQLLCALISFALLRSLHFKHW